MHRTVWVALGALSLGACQSYDPITQPGELYTEEQKAAMSTEEKVAAYNEQVDEKDQLICRRERRTGSHFHRTRCKTLQEAQEEREKSQEALQDLARSQQVGNRPGDL